MRKRRGVCRNVGKRKVRFECWKGSGELGQKKESKEKREG